MNFNDWRDQLKGSENYTEVKENLALNFDLANAVLAARMKKGWSQTQLAKAIGTKQANISRLESGLANPTLDFLSKLTNVLDLKIQFACVQELSIQYISEPARNVFDSSYIDIKSIEDLAYEVLGENRPFVEIKEYA